MQFYEIAIVLKVKYFGLFIYNIIKCLAEMGNNICCTVLWKQPVSFRRDNLTKCSWFKTLEFETDLPTTSPGLTNFYAIYILLIKWKKGNIRRVQQTSG